jgi:hypothetical protein
VPKPVRRFAAIASPLGIHAIEYSRRRDGIELEGGVRRLEEIESVDELAHRLADALGSMGGQGGELSLALSGFGTAHHILALPATDRDVLRPVVRRELLRYYPALDEPIVDFALAGDLEPGPEPKREVIVGAIPEATVQRLHRALAERGVVLRHLTVLPWVLHTLYATFHGGDKPAIVLLILDNGPLIGCFHRGSLRLFIEPPLDVHGRAARSAAELAEQVGRASLFLRQQFPSAAAASVLIAAPEGEAEAMRDGLARELDMEVATLSDTAAGSLAALATAVGAESAEGDVVRAAGVAGRAEASADTLELLPPALRPRGASEVQTRSLALATAVVLALAAVAWAGAEVASSRSEASRARSVDERVEARLPWIVGARDLLEQRQSHHHRLVFLDQTTATRTEVRRVMGAVSESTGPAVRLNRLVVEPAGDGWLLVLSGQALGPSSAAAVRAVDALYRGIPDRLPVTEVELGELTVMSEEYGEGVAIGFGMSFIVRWDRDLRP